MKEKKDKMKQDMKKLITLLLLMIKRVITMVLPIIAILIILQTTNYPIRFTLHCTDKEYVTNDDEDAISLITNS